MTPGFRLAILLLLVIVCVACREDPAPTATSIVERSPSPSPATGAWTRVRLPLAGISFEVPAGWVHVTDDGSWGAPSEVDACRRLAMAPPDPGRTACRSGLVEVFWADPAQNIESGYFLPNHLRVLSSAMEDIPPLGTVTRYRGVLEGSAALPGELAQQLYFVTRSPRLLAAFGLSAPTSEALDAAVPILEHLVRSVRFEP